MIIEGENCSGRQQAAVGARSNRTSALLPGWRLRNRGSGRRMAPYMREILAEAAAGRYPNLYCFAGSDAWERARRRIGTHGLASVTLLPPGEHPEAYIWPCVDAVVLVPGDSTVDRIRRLIRELLKSGCRCVVEVRSGGVVCHYAREPKLEARFP